MRTPSTVGALLLLGAAWTGLAQTPPPPCSLVLARKVPTKAVMAGRAFTTAVKVTNSGSTPVVVNLGVGLPDNVCAVKDAVFPRLKKTSSPARNGATVANQVVYWLEVPISPLKSRSFKLKARVSSNYTTTTTSISTSAYILDQGGNVTCLSTLAEAPLAIRARKKGPRPGTVLNCTRPAPPPNVKFYPFAFYNSLPYGFEVPVASAVSVMAAGFADQCYSACGSAQYALLSPYYFATTSTNKCLCSQSPDLVYDANATIFKAIVGATAAPTGSPTAGPTSSPSSSPTGSPTAGPTSSPSASPTGSPTAGPTSSPSASPTGSPTAAPTAAPIIPPGCAILPQMSIGPNPYNLRASGVSLPSTCGRGGVISDAEAWEFVAPESGIYEFKNCGSIFTDQVISLSSRCGDPLASLGCEDDGCSCAPGSCSSNLASSITTDALGGDSVFIYLGGYRSLNPAEDNSGVLTITKIS